MKKKPKAAKGVIGGVLVFLFLLSVFMAGHDLWRQKEEQKNFEELADLTLEPEEDAPPDTSSPEDAAETEKPQEESQRNLSALFEQNADCIGWLSIPGTTVDYPVMHTPEEPEKYLRKNFYGSYSTSGVPFLDSRCSLTGVHLIFYGHNMKNESMFGSLKYYTDTDYYAEHPSIELETAAGKAVYTIFSVMTVDKSDTWYRFLNADTESDFRHQIRYARECSLYDTGVLPSFGQQILTLSTCYGASGSDARLVIAAVKTE